MKLRDNAGIWILLLAALGCRVFSTNDNTANNASQPVEPSPSATAVPERTPTLDRSGPIEFPLPDFPPADTTGKEGEYVLVPSFNRPIDKEKLDNATFIWYAHTMSKPGAVMSEIQFLSEKREVANAFIIPIEKGHKAKLGDILLTWWQSGSGMQRAIVTDASDPIQPVVRYLDIDYDNPAKSRGGDTTIGRIDEKLKPDSFIVIRKEMDPGTSIIIDDGKRAKHGQVIRIMGNKVFAVLFTGKIGVFPFASTKGLPLKPNVKPGDRVRVVRFTGFSEVTVSRVDPKIGRVFVKYEGAKDETAVPFGNVIENRSAQEE
jgi:hypothetical protein